MSLSVVKSCKCDACGAELIHETSYPAVYALQLSAINVNVNTTGVEFCVAVIPPLDADRHFCGMACLTQWVETSKK